MLAITKKVLERFFWRVTKCAEGRANYFHFVYRWHRCWFLQTVPGFADFAGVVEITRLNTSEVYNLDELYGNELGFVLSVVSSNNTDVETTEQFIVMYARYVCDFSGLANLSQKLCKLEENIYIVFCFLLRFSCFGPRWTRWILWCLPRKEVSPQDCLLIPKVSYGTVYPKKLFPWPPVG